MACLIIGDSLAVGVGQFRPDCETVAKVGITSQTYLATRFPPQGVSADTVVISLGVNDGDTSGTQDNLESLRARINARTVYWLLPGLKEDVRRMILQVAGSYNDHFIDTRPEAGRDHLHPSGAGYQRIAAQTTGERREEVEVAFAPTEIRLPPNLGRAYPTRSHVWSKNAGVAFTTPRERIRRLRSLRAADESAPVIRRVSADMSYRVRPWQREMRVTTTLHSFAAPHGNRCPPHIRGCQVYVR